MMNKVGVPFLDLAVQDRACRGEIKTALARVVDSSEYVLGREVRAFEERFAEYVGVRHAVCVNSGTSALHLALLAAGVAPGDEVIVPAITFIATAMAVTYTGAKPVCVDVDDFHTLDANALEGAITDKTRAIVAVHLYGQPADMDAILRTAKKRGIAVIEDAAQAHGAKYRNRSCGSLADAAAWSFYPSKNLGALGEGGAVTTDNATVAEQCMMLRNWGQRGKDEYVAKGFNYRMDALQGAALGVKLSHLDEWTEMRIAAAQTYRKELANVNGVDLLAVREGVRCVWHVCAAFVKAHDRVAKALRARGIGVRIHYPYAIHLHPFYRDLGGRPGDFPNAEAIARSELSLPMFAGITPAQIETVAGALAEVL